MQRPIVVGYHLTWTAYGLWLPNDPRGGMSQTIACDVIAEPGGLHYGRKTLQPAGWVLREFHERAREVLKFPVLTFGRREMDVIGQAFAATMAAEKYTCYACAVMPDHVHIVIRKHKHRAEEMIETLQDSSRLRLRNAGLRDADHPVWGGPGWKVFLDHPDEIRRTIRYVEGNPVKWHLARQSWAFATGYDGWPLHPGHSPNSPYARRLREYHRQ